MAAMGNMKMVAVADHSTLEMGVHRKQTTDESADIIPSLALPTNPVLAAREKVEEDFEQNSSYGNVKEEGRRSGGWKTFPFIIGNELCGAIAITGLSANMIVYLTTQFNIKIIEATHIINTSNGGNELSPLMGAFLADAYLGRFLAISIGSVLSLIAMIILMLTAIVDPLRPRPCSRQLQVAGSCHGPTTGQYTVLFLYFALTIAASAGVRYNSGAFGADQFAKGTRQIQSYFNWYYCVLYIAILIASTVIVYIEASVSWAWGFGLFTFLTGISLLFFFSGTKLYNRISPEGSPFTGLAQVVVACVRKRHLELPSNAEDLYDGGITESARLPLTQELRFLNKAAIKTPQDFPASDSVGQINPNPWRLCSVEQVEELKSILKTLPIWSCGVIPSIMVSQQTTFSVLQALKMDRYVGSHFQIPAASFMVFALLSSALLLAIYDKVIVPLAAGKGIRITQLQRIGTGMFISLVGLGVAAMVESKRMNQADAMSALWLIPQYVITGLAEPFQVVGRIDFFYGEFPETVRSTATGLAAASGAVGFYLSSLLVSVVHKNSDWLANNLDQSRLDYFYALLCGMGVLNYVYFIRCARWYKYKAKKYVSTPALTSIALLNEDKP